MEQFYKYLDKINKLNTDGDVIKATESLKKLWDSLYLYEKIHRKRLIREINDYPNFTLGYEIENMFIKLDNLPFYFFDIEPKTNDRIISLNGLEKFKDKKLTEQEINLVLNTICNDGKRYLINEKKVNLKRDSLKDLCISSSEYLHFKYRNLFSIYTLRTDNIYSDCFPHQFCVIELDSVYGIKRFLIDLTYRQFCLLSKCNSLRIYNVYDNIIMPGYFFKETNELKKLLENGFLEINERTSKLYGESFILAGNSNIFLSDNLNDNYYSNNSYIKSLIYGTKVK